MVGQMVGQKLAGRYRLLKQLGQGGFGQAYLAIDEHLPDEYECVVKRFHMGDTQQQDTLQTAKRLFDAEAKALHRLGHHAQLPKLLAHFEDDGEFFLVEEYIPGPGLDAELMPGHAMPEEDVIQLLDDLLTVLSFVHQKQVIHRDIKPSNIIRRESDQRLVLIDFGAVKQVTTQMTGGTVRPHTVVIGTPGYMPSEQFRGSPKPSSDVYAVGMIGIQAITGLNPSLGELPEDDATGEIQWQEKANVSPELAKILSKMVLYDFRYRYRSAQEALEELQALGETAETTEVTTPGPEVAPTEVSIPMPIEAKPEWTDLPKTEVQGKTTVQKKEDDRSSVEAERPPAVVEPPPTVSAKDQSLADIPATVVRQDSGTPLPVAATAPNNVEPSVTKKLSAKKQSVKSNRSKLKWGISGGVAIAATGLFALLGTPHIAGICNGLGNCTAAIQAKSELASAREVLESADQKIKDAKTIEELESLQTQMKDALGTVESIGSDNTLKLADEAKNTSSTYEKELTQLTQRIKQEKEGQANFKNGVAKASEAFQEKSKAESIAAKDDNIKKWQAAVDLLQKVEKPTFKYSQAQAKKKDYEAHIKNLNASIDKTLAEQKAWQQEQAAARQAERNQAPAYQAPAPSYASSGGGSSYQEPAYQAPAPVYQEPAYQAPAPVYQEPAYQAPAPAPAPAPSQEPLWGGGGDPQAEPLW